ncbi:MAG: hypothetical protein B7Y02_08290 [Rhodobacterales bacterium 17-64-5]|nr:MAG: hypothetical protein B7Y02_08290 [Rhodobacterales bacterium 17-64-5]
MHIAILVTNTDTSAFATRHPRDAEKFRALIAPRRPLWQISSFDLPKGEFPADPLAFDGYIIGGSPASVNDDAVWIARLMRAIPVLAASGKPVFGACFGHQAIALALGGTVTRNPGGWAFGVTETEVITPTPWTSGPLRVNAAHSEQVTVLPQGAEVISRNAACAVGAFRIGHNVLTTQYHPEITPDFMAGLVAEYGPRLPPQVAARAQASLSLPAEVDRMADGILAFLGQASG